ncbi:hypothetical protein TGAMA5MH_04026 [Trichoderma gamsii]|uniref:Uncharacterized protein n=1 Tax=Trichoderma gamsii TaxID=398673 RepID=A0A2K0TDY7_9HYPO|nr:hypothetical protein TGAMA5MH_04026 [Trichoderma gamsii]
MAGFFNKIKSASTLQPSTAQTTKDVVPKKKDEIVPELTPLEKMLQNAGALREDGTDKFFGFENFGNTWFASSCRPNQDRTTQPLT